MPNFLELTNASILKDGDYFGDSKVSPQLRLWSRNCIPISAASKILSVSDSIDFRYKRRRTVRSPDNKAKQHKKHRKRRKHKRKNRKRHKGANGIDQGRHKGNAHKAAASRRKRGYLDKEFWDSLDSGYEKPLIYSAVDMANLKPDANDKNLGTGKSGFEDADEKYVQGYYERDMDTFNYLWNKITVKDIDMHLDVSWSISESFFIAIYKRSIYSSLYNIDITPVSNSQYIEHLWIATGKL